MEQASGWTELLARPARGAHMVQLYQDEAFLAEAVVEYLAAGLSRGEAAVVIATPAHRQAFVAGLARRGIVPGPALYLLDAEESLSGFMTLGQPSWREFRESIGGLIAGLARDYPAVRAYGEMVDVLWQRGERRAAAHLEEFWNELGTLESFSLLCAYRLDNLDAGAYGGPIECVCGAHTHLIPARDYGAFNEAVSAASRDVLDHPLVHMLDALAARQRPLGTHMPAGQATLIWLGRNMPRTAERVLARVRARQASAA